MTILPKTETRPGADRARRAKTVWYRVASLVLTLFVVGSTVLFLAQSHGEIRQAARGVIRADPRWVAFTLSIQLVAIALIAVKYRLLLRRLGYRLPTMATARMHVRRHAVSSVLPFGGASSLVTFARDLGRYGVAAEDAAFTAGLSSLVSEIAFAMFLLPVLAGMVVTGEVTGPMLVGSLVMLVVTAALVVTLLLVSRLGAASPLRRRLPSRLLGIMERAGGHGVGPRDLVAPVALNLGVNVVGVITLYASCRAVSATPSPWTIVVGRMIGSVFMLVAPFMQGAGAVELSVTATLRKAGVPTVLALATVVMFRVAQFWFPLAMGAAAYVRVDRVATAVRGRVSPAIAGAIASGGVFLAAMALARPDLDHPTLQDEEGIFWLLALGLALQVAWIAFGGQAMRLRRAFVRQRVD
jgi:uncharacterized membrane protein YbhN (UPF0104 family)